MVTNALFHTIWILRLIYPFEMKMESSNLKYISDMVTRRRSLPLGTYVFTDVFIVKIEQNIIFLQKLKEIFELIRQRTL